MNEQAAFANLHQLGVRGGEGVFVEVGEGKRCLWRWGRGKGEGRGVCGGGGEENGVNRDE